MLINSAEELKQVLGALQATISWKTIGPYVEQAQLAHLVPVLGQPILDVLQAGLDESRADAPFLALLAAVRRPLAYFAQLEALPFLNARVGDLGVHEVQTEKAAPARQWTYQSLELATAKQADVFLDAAVRHLEQHAATWPQWVESEACTVLRGQLMPDATTFSRYINVQGSRRAFLAFRPYLDRAEELMLQPLVGSELLAGLKARLVAGTSTAADTAAVLRIRPALAQLALADGVLELSISAGGAGLSVLTDNYTIRQRLASSQEELEKVAGKARALAERYLTELGQFLQKNVTAYPEYADSDAYQTPGANPTYSLPDNAGSSGFWV